MAHIPQFGLVTSAAIQGNAHAQFALGVYYTKGTKPNWSRAQYYLKMACRQGHREAQCFLGMWLLMHGNNLPEAIKLLKIASNQGSGHAALNLGLCYLRGDGGVPMAMERAFSEFQFAASTGSAEGQFMVAECLSKGSGVSQNEKMAFQWYLSAALQGLPRAQVAVGLAYAKGRGTGIDLQRSVFYFTLATCQGNIEGEFNLGHCYYHGNGVEKDHKMAIQLWASAAMKGLPQAVEALKIIVELK